MIFAEVEISASKFKIQCGSRLSPPPLIGARDGLMPQVSIPYQVSNSGRKINRDTSSVKYVCSKVATDTVYALLTSGYKSNRRWV